MSQSYGTVSATSGSTGTPVDPSAIDEDDDAENPSTDTSKAVGAGGIGIAPELQNDDDDSDAPSDVQLSEEEGSSNNSWKVTWKGEEEEINFLWPRNHHHHHQGSSGPYDGSFEKARGIPITSNANANSNNNNNNNNNNHHNHNHSKDHDGFVLLRYLCIAGGSGAGGGGCECQCECQYECGCTPTRRGRDRNRGAHDRSLQRAGADCGGPRSVQHRAAGDPQNQGVPPQGRKPPQRVQALHQDEVPDGKPHRRPAVLLSPQRDRRNDARRLDREIRRTLGNGTDRAAGYSGVGFGKRGQRGSRLDPVHHGFRLARPDPSRRLEMLQHKT
eukprot:jgi/Psemu1/306912/fgenesh1_kg.289_\